MSSEAHQSEHSPEPGSSAGLLAQLKLQCERLRQLVQEFEARKQEDGKALAAAQAELREYRQLLYKWADQQVREEDWRDFRETDYTIPAEAALRELEQGAVP
jgi:hypothetical protein